MLKQLLGSHGNSPSVKLFQKQLIIRSVKSILVICFLNILTLSAFYITTSWSVINPLRGLISLLSHFFSWHSFLFWLWLNFISIVLYIIYCLCHELTPCLFIKRSDELKHFASKLTLFFISLYSGFICILIVILNDYDYSNYLTNYANKPNPLLINIYALSAGIYLSLSAIHTHRLVLSFPPIHQPKIYRMQYELLKIIKPINMLTTLGKLITIFVINYIIFGIYIKSWLIRFYYWSSEFGSSDTSSHFFLNFLIPPTLIYNIFIYGLFTLVHIEMVWCIVNITLTERASFVTISEQSQLGELPGLDYSLAQTDLQLMQHLAFQELSLSSLYSSAKREELFSLCPQTGQSVCWTRTITHVVKTVQDALTLISGDDMPFYDNFNIPHSVPSPYKPNQPALNSRNFARSALYTPMSLRRRPIHEQSQVWATLGTPSPLSHDQTSQFTSSIGTSPMPPRVKNLSDKIVTEAKNALEKHRSLIWGRIKSRMQSSFPWRFLNEQYQPNLYFESYSNALLVRWAVTALGNLCLTAYKEDKYGIVQANSLAQILTVLLSLSKAMECHKLPSSFVTKKISTIDILYRLNVQRLGLQSTVNGMLIQLSFIYAKHLDSIQLSNEHAKRLEFIYKTVVIE